MTICDKINEVGETLQENLNDRGVSCTFGTGTGESTVLDMVEMVNGTNFKGSSDVNLKIGANRPYLMTGETTDVVVKLENGLCEPLNNKNVTIKQSIFIDNGTTASHNSNMQLYQGVRTITDTGTLIETDSNNRWDIRPNNFGLFDTPFNVEFDVVDTSNRLAITLYNSSTSIIGEWDSGATLQSGDKIRVEVSDTDAKFYVNDVLESTKTYTSTSKVKFRVFYNVANNYLKYKNFKVYETINGVTDEKGEFALYDVSVTDDTTFTASYGTETATCLVEYCTYVNYLVDNEHDANSYYGTGTVTYDKIGAKLDATTFSSSNYQLNFRPIDDVVTVPYEVKFEILENDTVNFRTYFHNTNFSGSAIASATFYTQNQQPTTIRFVVTSSGITRYVGNTSTALTVSTSIASEVGVRFGYWQPTTGKVKIRNFRIKSL